MLQILVRPDSLDLNPDIQHNWIPGSITGEWRHPFAPEGTNAALCVRSPDDFYDYRLVAGATTMLPSRLGWDNDMHVFDGAVEVGDGPVGFTESALMSGGGDVAVTATEDAIAVAFSVKLDGPITRQGTIGR